MPPEAIASALLDPGAFPLLLPHLVVFDDEMYSGNALIATLLSEQSDFLRCCDGSHTLAEAVKATGVGTEFVTRFAGHLLWWHEPVAEAPDLSGSVDRLVLGSRPEEPWLGMGGRILLEARQKRTVILTCFTLFSANRYANVFATHPELRMACWDESSVAARLAGINQTMWGIPASQARKLLASAEADMHRLAKDVLREAVSAAIEQMTPAEVFVPGAMADSADARLLLETALSLAAEGRLQGGLHMFEDSPSVLGERKVDEFHSLFEKSYFNPCEYYVDVTGASMGKASLLNVFRCRVDTRQRRSWAQSIRRNARNAGLSNGNSAERFWQIQFGGLE